ncbi:MAG: hypothetical protein AB2L12_01510 [Smithellaceae bacterium]
MEKPVAIVTGGGVGNGVACVKALSGKRFCVRISCRSSEDFEKKLLSEIGAGFLIRTDLSSIGDVEAMATGLKKSRFG